jgi:phosphatidylinositol alpha-1,6-mannosyltransferase
VLSVIGFFATLVTRKPVIASVIHGLDVTYKSSFYQLVWVRMFLPSLTKLIAVSLETKNIAIQYGLSENKITVIPNGVDLQYEPGKFSRSDLSKLLGFDTQDTVILLTHGRLAKRKGAEWFINNVLVSLPANIHYVLSGDGPEREAIQKAVVLHGLEKRVTLLGKVSDATKLTLLHTADIFIQPNITVPGDIEGFGISVIEATSCARPVLVSNMEGLTDAIANGKNGVALPSGDTHAWQDAVLRLARNPEKRTVLGKQFQNYTEEHFSWEKIIQEYLRALASKK